MSGKGLIYTVHAYRWGDKEAHSYSVGVYTRKKAALDAAQSEEEWRGGKYECEVEEWDPNVKSEDGDPKMPRKVIKAVTKTSRIRLSVTGKV